MAADPAGLTGGTFSLPEQTSARPRTTSRKAGADPVEPVLGQVTWTPETLGAVVNTSRKVALAVPASTSKRSPLRHHAGPDHRNGPRGDNGAGTTSRSASMQDTNCPTYRSVHRRLVDLGHGRRPPGTVAAANAEFAHHRLHRQQQGPLESEAHPQDGSTFPVFLWDNGQAPGRGHRQRRTRHEHEPDPRQPHQGVSSTASALIYGNWNSSVPTASGRAATSWSTPYSGSSLRRREDRQVPGLRPSVPLQALFAKCLDMDIS